MAFPVIGADFLANFKIAMDLSGMQLLCPVGLKIQLEAPHGSSLTAAHYWKSWKRASWHPPPQIEDLSKKLKGMKVFSTINLRKGYWQVPVAAADVPRTAIITPLA